MTSPDLSLDCLRRLQETLQRRIAPRDPDNIVSVGFAPVRASRPDSPAAPTGEQDSRIVAQFDVSRKRQSVTADKKIQPTEAVRLLDRQSQSYRELQLGTDVVEVGDLIPTGVRISTPDEHATTSLVVRWTTLRPVPPRPTLDHADDPRWRWGVITVSHLFVGRGTRDATSRARVRRVAACGHGPEAVNGRVVRRGRIPGGPDIALIETGWDRLWLSGFVPEVGLPPLVMPTEADLTRWASRGASGTFVGDRVTHAWKWQAFYPSLSIPSLGQLQHLVSYRLQSVSGNTKPTHPFGPGSSGGVVIADGIVIGLQVAAMRPDFDIGYAQTLDVGTAWLKKLVNATAFEVVHVVDR